MILNSETKNKINEYLIRKLGMYDYRRGWLKGDCPSCGKHKFGVNLGQNKSNCFSCGLNLKPLDIIKEVESNQLKTETVLPEGYRNIKRGNSVLAKSARAFVKRRGFDIDKMSSKGWGYGSEGKYYGYLIMPFYIDNRLVYFNARLYLGSGPKFNNPDISEFGLGKSFIIYNKEALYLYKTVWVVESVTNSETIGDHACAMGGKSLSAVQVNEIIKSPCEKIIIGLDRDALDKSIDLAFKLIEYKKVKVIVMDNHKDINDIGRNKSLSKSYNSHYMSSYKDVMKLKNNLGL